MTSWPTHYNSTLFLAPMEGVTDFPMRSFFSQLPGFSHFVTEFLRVSQNALPPKVIRRHMKEILAGGYAANKKPVVLQLLGGNPERLAQTAVHAVLAGAKAIDLNFGCPAPTVNKNDGGATLLKYPHRIRSIVQAVRSALPLDVPVSAKLRLGWENPDSIYENASMAAEGGAAWITIHGRTKMQGYMPPAYWEPMRKVQETLKIPVVANGEIWTMEDFLRCRDQSRCRHFMIGRGALANPHLASRIATELGLEPASLSSFPEENDWSIYLLQFLSICEQESKNDLYGVKRTKQWLRYAYQKTDFPDFDQIKLVKTLSEMKHSLKTIRYPKMSKSI